jgi:methionine synthase II (cobalamin-independent)
MFGLAEALREEYKAIIDAGLDVQIDDAIVAGPKGLQQGIPMSNDYLCRRRLPWLIAS